MGKIFFEPLEERILLNGGPYANSIGEGFNYFGDSGEVKVSLNGSGRGTWKIDAQKDLFMELSGTTDKTTVKIKGNADIESLDVIGSLKSLDGKDSDVEGDVSVTGYVGSVKLENILDGARVEVRGADSVRLYGVLFGEYEAVNGSTNKFDVKGFVSGGSVVTAENFGNGSFKVKGSVSNNSFIGEFYQYSIGGSLSSSVIETGRYVKSIKVKSSVTNSVVKNLYTFGTIESFSSGGSFTDSSIFVNYNSGADNVYGTFDDGGLIDGNPAKQLSVKVKGVSRNSYVVAKSVKSVKYGSLSSFNNGREFGIFASNFQELISRGLVKYGSVKYTRPVTDFVVEDIGEFGRPPPLPPPF